MKKISITTLLLLSFFQQILAQCTTFSEGFETAGLPNWTIGPSITAHGITSSAAVGNFCLIAEGGNSTHTSGLSTTIAPSQPQEISWYMKPTGSLSSNYVVMGNSSITATECVFFCFWSGTLNSIRFVNFSLLVGVPPNNKI